MAAVPPASERRRPRPGSLERPINGRLYRGTWLFVGLPLLVLPSLPAVLIAAFFLAAPVALLIVRAAGIWVQSVNMLAFAPEPV